MEQLKSWVRGEAKEKTFCAKLYIPITRAQPDIPSGPEVRQIFKCPDSGLPVFLLPGLRTLRNRKKSKKKFQKKNFQKKFSKFFFKFFFHNFFFVYLYGKMSKNISPDSVRSGRTCPANLGVRTCPVRKLICPVRLSPSNLLLQKCKYIQGAGHLSWGGMYTIVYSDLYYLRRNKGLNTHCASFSCAKFYWRVAVLCASMKKKWLHF